MRSFILQIVCGLLIMRCGSNETSGQPPIKKKAIQTKKRIINEKVIDRNSLNISYILDSLIYKLDTTFSKGPIKIVNDTIISGSFIDAIERKGGSSLYKWKAYTDKYDKDIYSVIYTGCSAATFSLRFYSDEVYIFNSGDAAFFIDLKKQLYLVFIPEVSGRLPYLGCNSSFYILDDNLFPIIGCHATHGKLNVNLVTKISKTEFGSLGYKVHDVSIIGKEYDDLSYKDILQ